MHAEKRKELRVVVLLDGRPGHEKQTMGIIQGLQARVPVQLERICVPGFSAIDWLRQTCRLLLMSEGLSHPSITGVDLLLGTGSRTHLPLLLYKKKCAIPAITCMAPPAHLRGFFDLCFVPEHDGRTEAGNIMLTIGAPNTSQNKRAHRVECGLILLGGIDPKSHSWDSQQVANMVEKIVETETGVSWTVSSSPRTPPDMVAMVEQLTARHANSRFFDYRHTAPGWVEAQYDRNSTVWVTADSISMIYEALTAGCRVGIFPMRWRRENGKFKRNEDLLLRKGLVADFSSWERGEKNLGASPELNEAQRCADRILQQWWPQYLL